MVYSNKRKYNPFFYVPFFIWVVVGGGLYLTYGKDELFRSINGCHSPWADSIMWIITFFGQAEVIVPMLLLLGVLPRYRKWPYFLMATLCNVIPMLVQQSMKAWFDAIRPLKYYESAAWIHRLPHWPELFHHSFPSGHSEGAFAFFTFLSFLLPARFRWAGFVFFLLGLLACYSRVYLAAHFFEDIYAGSIIGVVIATIVFWAGVRFVKPVAKLFSVD